MNNKQFTCIGIEWYFLRTFIVIEEGAGFFHEKLLEEVRKNTKKLEIAIILFIILAISVISWVIFQILPTSSFKNNMNLVFIFLTISLIIASLLIWVWYGYRYMQINKSSTVLPGMNEELILYKMNQNGIYLNLYNRLYKDEMIFLEWEKVKNISLGHMRYLPFYFNPSNLNKKQQKRKLYRLFNNMKKKLDTFPYEPKFKYDNVQSVYLLHTNEKYISELPIPPSWHKNGLYDCFITDLKQYINLAPESILNKFTE